MTKEKMITSFKRYQRASLKKRNQYLQDFEAKMVYRTTKTENPETTRKMVNRVLHKFVQ